MSAQTRIYTDGGCTGNPGPGGWAAVILSADSSGAAAEPLEISGGDPSTTNNRMELTAVIEALRRIDGSGGEVEVLTDSKYVQRGMSEWMPGWIAKNWRTAGGGPVKNQDLWKTLKSLDDRMTITWTWVKGHAGRKWNERCDRLVAEQRAGYAQGKGKAKANAKAKVRPETEAGGEAEPRTKVETETETARKPKAESGALPRTNGEGLLHDIRDLISQARSLTRRSINAALVVSNYLIGMRIVREEQKGRERAAYGAETLIRLADKLTKEFGRGYSRRNLVNMRNFYLAYQSVVQSIFPLTSMEAGDKKAVQDVSLSLEEASISGIWQKWQTLSAKLPLSWSHYLFLMGINNTDTRRFYELETVEQGWTLRELRRQFDSGLYERLALSRDKKGVRELSEKGERMEKPSDLVRDPYVLEFLGLDEKANYSETELESAIIDRLEDFLLELGRGFLFEARQKRFTFEHQHFFVDLVFYNRLLRCYVLIDLKIGELKHQDIGQMQMYVNYFDRFVKLDDEQKTVGIILCQKKNDSMVKITLPEGAHVHAAAYETYLPDKDALRMQLEEARAEWEAARGGAEDA